MNRAVVAVSFGQGECVPAIRGHMVRGQQMLLTWEPRAGQANLGVSFCVDASQGDCYVLDVYGFRAGRLAYTWRHHSALEAGVGAWVPGRDTLLPERHLQADDEVSLRRGKHVTVIKLFANLRTILS